MQSWKACLGPHANSSYGIQLYWSTKCTICAIASMAIVLVTMWSTKCTGKGASSSKATVLVTRQSTKCTDMQLAGGSCTGDQVEHTVHNMRN